MFFKIIYKVYKEKFYDEMISEFIGVIPKDDREPVLDFLADRRVLFERFLSIQAYHIQRARIQSKKTAEFYDGALMIIKAFLAAVNRKVVQRTTVVPQVDQKAEMDKSMAFIGDFLKSASDSPIVQK